MNKRAITIVFVIAVIISSAITLGCTSSSETDNKGPQSSATPAATQKPTATPTPAPENKLGFSKSNPAPIGTPVTYSQTGSIPYTATLTILEVVRGDEAMSMLEEANMFNGPPSDTTMEYLLVKARFSLDKFSGYKDYSGKQVDTLGVTDYDFQAVSDKKFTGHMIGVIAPSPNFGDTLFEGGVSEGWFELPVYKDDPHPYIEYGDTSSYSNDQVIWFQV